MKPVRVLPAILKSLDPKDYTLEFKYDGWRAIVLVEKTASLWTREKKRLEIPKNLQDQLRALELPPGTVLDGEIWNPTKRGGWKQSAGDECKLTLWDCIQIGEKNISKFPIEDRREALHSLLKPEYTAIQPVEVQMATQVNYEIAFKLASEVRAETAARSGFIHGVVLKRNGSPRRDHATRSTEHPDWLKIVFEGMSGWAIRG